MAPDGAQGPRKLLSRAGQEAKGGFDLFFLRPPALIASVDGMNFRIPEYG